MKQTLQLPTKPGWYWVFTKGIDRAAPYPFKITEDEDGTLLFHLPADGDVVPLTQMIQDAREVTQVMGYAIEIIFSETPIPELQEDI